MPSEVQRDAFAGPHAHKPGPLADVFNGERPELPSFRYFAISRLLDQGIMSLFV